MVRQKIPKIFLAREITMVGLYPEITTKERFLKRTPGRC
jgi:hypothetical protein